MIFNPLTHRYGKPCKKGHTVKYKCSGSCVECDIERRNSPRLKAYRQQYYQENKEQIDERNRQYRQQNRDRVTEYLRQYFQTPEGKAKRKQMTYKRRSKRGAERWTAEQLAERFALFEGCCAYCGSTDELTIDHFLPLSKDGTDELGNIVPACGRCNSSKFNHPPLKWYTAQDFFEGYRFLRIINTLDPAIVDSLKI